jgi:putative Mg2+ transporter-C (MgtC) family protein
MDEFFHPAPLIDAVVPVLTAIICGLALGAEREANRHAAGLRTLGLISLGSCLFTMCGRWLTLFPLAGDGVGAEAVVDPGRLASYVIAGVGFLGAGPIITRASGAEGLTTAASIWSTAAIGVLAGLGFVQMAIAATVLILVVLMGLRSCAARMRGDPDRRGEVVLIADDHLALSRVRLLTDGNHLVSSVSVAPRDDRWQLRLKYRGDEVVVQNLLEALSSIPGVRGGSVSDVERGLIETT